MNMVERVKEQIAGGYPVYVTDGADRWAVESITRAKVVRLVDGRRCNGRNLGILERRDGLYIAPRWWITEKKRKYRLRLFLGFIQYLKQNTMLQQRFYGLVLLIVCGFILWMCSAGQTMEDRDATAVLLIAPLGLYMLFSKNICI